MSARLCTAEAMPSFNIIPPLPEALALPNATGMIHTSCARRTAALETYPITSKADLPKTATIDKLSSNLSTDKGP